MATRTELIKDVALELQTNGIGQSLDAALFNEIGKKVDRVNAWLVSKNIAWWGDDVDCMPEEAIEAFISLTAARSTRVVASPDDDVIQLGAKGQGALADLRQMSAVTATGETIEFRDY